MLESCHAQQPGAVGLASLEAFDIALAELIQRCEKSVVAISRQPPANGSRGALLIQPRNDPFGDLRTIQSLQQPASAVGSGIVIDEAGLIVTQYLVVNPGDRHTVTTIGGDQHAAEIRAADPRSGLAVLSVQGAALQPLAVGKAESLRKGSSVVAIGNPHAVISDGQPTASYGRVTNIAQKASPQVNLNNAKDDRRGDYRTTLHHFGSLIQTDAQLGWNANGGALVNMRGELIGLTTTVSVIAGHEQPAGYAIPFSPAFRRILQTLKQGREVEYGLLGVSFSASPPSSGTRVAQGIVVQQAYAGGPASRAGLQARDAITRIAGQPVPNPDRLQLLVGSQPPGAVVAVDYSRNGASKQTEVVLGKYYTAGEKVVTVPASTWRGMRVDYATAVPPELLASASRQGLIDPAGCVVVADVDPESLSWKQGIRPGVFISHVAGTRVGSPAEFWTALEEVGAAGPDGSASLRFTQPLKSSEVETAE